MGFLSQLQGHIWDKLTNFATFTWVTLVCTFMYTQFDTAELLFDPYLTKKLKVDISKMVPFPEN